MSPVLRVEASMSDWLEILAAMPPDPPSGSAVAAMAELLMLSDERAFNGLLPGVSHLSPMRTEQEPPDA